MIQLAKKTANKTNKSNNTTRNKKSSKKTKVSFSTTEILSSIVVCTLSLMGLLRLGIVGIAIAHFYNFFFGVFSGVILILIILYFSISVFHRKWYQLTQRKIIAGLVLLFSVMVLAVILSEEYRGIKGTQLTTTFHSSNNFFVLKDAIQHGIVPVSLYAFLSSLFDIIGAMIIVSLSALVSIIIIFREQFKAGIIKYQEREKRAPRAEYDEPDLYQRPVQRVKSRVVPERKKKKFFDYEQESSKKTPFDHEQETSKKNPFDYEQTTSKKSTFDFGDDMDDVEPTTVKDQHFKYEAPEPDIFKYGETTTPAVRDFDLHVSPEQVIPDNQASEPKLKPKTERRVQDFNPSDNYVLPDISLLEDLKAKDKVKDNIAYVDDTAKNLVEVMNQFGITCNISNVNIGPTVTRYEIKLAPGTRVNKVSALQDDIKMALAAKDIRIEAPIPGKNAVGVEVPNRHNMLVSFKEILVTMEGQGPLSVVLGKDINGLPVTTELNRMPHLLVAGATGSGKSVCINTIIMSLLMRTSPEQVKLVLIDPKKVELSGFNGLPHLLTPVVTNPKKASVALRRVVEIMEERYELFSHLRVKNIEAYQKVAKNDLDLPDMPYIVTIIDELSDLMMVSAKEVEESIMRITQMARAAGIHLIVATQRPSTDVITGVIKANIPSRIAFAVSSSIDSRTILDSMGAERLLGKGDMLFLKMGESSAVRVQGAFLTDEDIHKVVHFITTRFKIDIEDQLFKPEESSDTFENDNELDDLYHDAVAFVKTSQKASTSLLQRRFRIGYNRAARLIDDLEAQGIIGPVNGSKPREVLIQDDGLGI